MLEDIRNGIGYGYPICCIAAYRLTKESAVKRGAKYTKRGTGPFVPCGVFHKADRSYNELYDMYIQRHKRTGLVEWQTR